MSDACYLGMFLEPVDRLMRQFRPIAASALSATEKLVDDRCEAQAKGYSLIRLVHTSKAHIHGCDSKMQSRRLTTVYCRLLARHQQQVAREMIITEPFGLALLAVYGSAELLQLRRAA